MRPLLFLGVAACSGGGEPATLDAAPDAPQVKVVELSSCPSAIDASMIDSANAFIPDMLTVRVGGIVKISTTAEHFVIPNNATNTDPALMVGRNQSVCFRFDIAGTYGIACGAHGFAASIIVE
jgi:plastocyanin